MCQRYYPIPFDKLKPSGNTLTVLDEMGAANLSAVRLAVSENKAPPACTTTAGKGATMYTCGQTDPVALVPVTAAGAGGTSYHTIETAVPKPQSPLCLQDPAQSLGNTSWAACQAGAPSQQWIVEEEGPSWKLLHPRGAPSKCLEVFGQSVHAGATVDVWACHGGANQQWALKSRGLLSALAQRCLSSC